MEAWARDVGNLSTEAANQRLQRGIVMLGVALVLAIVLVYLDLHSAWRAVLFVPFFVSAQFFFSGLHRT